MNARTRQLISHLVDDLTAQILDLCREEGRSEQELATKTGAARQTVATRLRFLETYGIVSSSLVRSGSAGRPTTTWEIGVVAAIDGFHRFAEAFILELLEAATQEQRASIDARRRRDVQATEPSEDEGAAD